MGVNHPISILVSYHCEEDGRGPRDERLPCASSSGSTPWRRRTLPMPDPRPTRLRHPCASAPWRPCALALLRWHNTRRTRPLWHANMPITSAVIACVTDGFQPSATVGSRFPNGTTLWCVLSTAHRDHCTSCHEAWDMHLNVAVTAALEEDVAVRVAAQHTELAIMALAVAQIT